MDTKIPSSSPVPGVSTGVAPASTVASGNAPVEGARLPRLPDIKKTVVPHGGNSGGRPRNDRLVPGSPEAIEADRIKEAKRSKDRRAAARAETPERLPPVASLPASPTDAPGVSLGASPGFDVLEWSPADFNQVAVDCVNLADTWNVQRKIKKCKDGKLAPLVCAEIGRDAAFPPNTKESLSKASPASLAKLFNALHIPLAAKSIITVAPSLTYIVLRDFQLDAKIDKLIADEAERNKPKPTP